MAYSEEEESERSKNTVRAVLENIRKLDNKIQMKINKMQEKLSEDMRSNNNSKMFYASYTAHDAVEPGGIHINTLK